MVYFLHMRRYTLKKTYNWTADIAYLAGLIASDGCMVNNRRHINLTSKDKELIDVTQKILGMNVKVSIKKSMYGGSAYHLQFSNVALYDFFIEAGIMPAKSKILSAVNVPDDYYAHFLRGYFDGDGCIYSFWDKRWRSSFMYYTEYTSASPSFLHWLRAQNQQLAHTTPGRIRNGRGADALSYAKLDSRLLFDFMYPSPEVPRLSRKFSRFVDFFGADPYADKKLGASAGIGRQATLRM